MENLKGKLVFIRIAGGESALPSSGVIAILDDIKPDYIRVKEAGIFALLPTAKGAQATIMPMDPTANQPVDGYIMKAQIVSVVPVGEKSKLRAFHQQFKAAAAGIELPGSIDISNIKNPPGGGLSIS